MTKKRIVLISMDKLIIKFFLILLLILQYSTATANEQNKIFDLNRLYKLAVKHSESIKIAEENVFIAKQDKSRAFSVLVPRFTAFGSYSLEESDQTTSAKPASALSTYADLSQTTDTVSWGVRFDQSFSLNGKELLALNISKDLIEKSQYDLRAIKNEYLFQVASAYYLVLQATKAKEIGYSNVKRLEKHKNAVKARLALEAVTQTDMYRAESELSDAKSEYIDLENSLKYSKAILKSLVRLPVDFILTEPDKTQSHLQTLQLSKLIETGILKRAEMKSSKTSYEISKKNTKLAKSAYWPTVSINGQYVDNDVTNDGKYDSAKIETEIDSTAYSVGASLSFTLFDGGLRRAEIKQANAQKRQARLACETTKKRIGLEIEDTYLKVETHRSKLLALSDKLKFSQQTYKAVSEQFKHGLSNSVDMMDANTLLVSAERELSNAEYQYKLALLKLKNVTGTFLDEVGL